MKVSTFLACAALASLTAFAAGCTMPTESGDTSDESDGAPEGSEPAKDPEAYPLFRFPNLAAVDASGQVPAWGGSYCSFDAAGNFVVRVKNIGNATSAPSVVRMAGGAGTQDRNVSSLAPGATQTITLPFWSFAFCGPDCHFSITVDVTDTNAEWDEDNTFYGYCIG
jgi:hypothetical protein